jgi:hypothetical protein
LSSKTHCSKPARCRATLPTSYPARVVELDQFFLASWRLCAFALVFSVESKPNFSQCLCGEMLF